MKFPNPAVSKPPAKPAKPSAKKPAPVLSSSAAAKIRKKADAIMGGC